MTDKPQKIQHAERAWQHPWLRLNLLLRQMTKAFRVREARPILKTEVTNALRTREEMKRARWWN
jgi:hypothetical protein